MADTAADPASFLNVQLASEAAMSGRLEAMLAAVSALGEFRTTLRAGVPGLDASTPAGVLAQAMFAGEPFGPGLDRDEAGRAARAVAELPSLAIEVPRG